MAQLLLRQSTCVVVFDDRTLKMQTSAVPGCMFHIRSAFRIVDTAILDRCRISRVTFSLRDVPVHVLYYLQPRCNTPGFIENERFQL